ncbi:hypothetical protein GSY74_10040, partial [Sulfurovum sp. bin170]|nr:hypothetical protein [Sulfurovum sp. bin170]
FKNDGLEIITHHRESTPRQEKEQPQNRFSEFAGIWKDRDITQESIREKAWK